MNIAYEVNFDGLIGPSHNYGGLSDGNLASAKNAGDVSSPREAALQGLEKMRRMVRAGLKQGVLPPLERPSSDLLMATGFGNRGDNEIEEAARYHPAILKAAYSASSMWTANAATVSPSADTQDGRLHFTTANLSTMLHRSIEHPDTTALLHAIFENDKHFCVHPALPLHSDYADEGAANHVRLCGSHGESAVEVFVFGRDGNDAKTDFPARQTLLASQCISGSHGLNHARTVMVRQSRQAIDAGAFHNDVVCVGSLDTLFFHELAFEDTQQALSEIRSASEGLFELKPVLVPNDEVPLQDAISSYLFNSQLLQIPGEDRLVLVAPTETQDNQSTRDYCQRLVESNGPIGRVDFVDVRQSMRNGGGPACLRLRVVMTDAELAACHQGVMLDDAKINALQDVVKRTYRAQLAPTDLADPNFAGECINARAELLKVLELDALI